jgi:hypothetical protein
MCEPASYRHEVDAGHDALAGAEMPEVVEANAVHASLLADQLEGLSKAMSGNVLWTALRRGKQKGGIRRPGLTHFMQENLEFWSEIDGPAA